MSSTYSPLSGFPTELLIRILHFAATSSRASCLSLCRVSTWTREIAMPHLMSTVTLSGTSPQGECSDVVLFARQVSKLGENCPPPSSAALVRDLWLPSPGDGLIFPILKSCNNITNLAASDSALNSLFQGTSGDLPVEILNQDLRLTVLYSFSSTPWSNIKKIAAREKTRRSPLCDVVTRLHFTEGYFYEEQLEIQHFPRLSHLALPIVGYNISKLSLLSSVLASTTLQSLVLCLYTEDLTDHDHTIVRDWVREARKSDKRVHFVGARRRLLQKDWTDEMDGRETIWERAVQETAQWERSL